MDHTGKDVPQGFTSDQGPPPSLLDTMKDEGVWTRDSLSPDDWVVPLPEACLEELHAVLRWLRQHPQPVWHLTPVTFALSACAEVMEEVRIKLTQQAELAVLDRVPVERYSTTERKAMFWLLARLLGQVVAQKWDGTLRLTAYASVGFFQRHVLVALLAALPIVGTALFLGGRLQTGFRQ